MGTPFNFEDSGTMPLVMAAANCRRAVITLNLLGGRGR